MIDVFKDIIRADVEEFITTRQMQKARELTRLTGQHFNHNEYPMYFTGNLEAKMVLVHLNPKQRNNYADVYHGPLWLKTFDQYFDYHRYFGKYNNGQPSPQQSISLFDSKQIQFLRPFHVIDFVEEHTRTDRFTNLVKVIDEKLQLELIPYGSDTFSPQGFTPTILQPHIDRILNVITACPRSYIIFCGNVFEMVFGKYITARHAFRLTKKNGQLTRNQARFSNLQIDYQGQKIRAGLAHSFAQQGIPMAEYGRYCQQVYS